jgi:hypothetical protein
MNNRIFLSGNIGVIETYNKKFDRYFYIIVDREDLDLIKNNATSVNVQIEYYTEYATYRCYTDKKSKRLHRLIMNDPKGYEVDHINHIGLDNRKCNLRKCTSKENSKNRRLYRSLKEKLDRFSQASFM